MSDNLDDVFGAPEPEIQINGGLALKIVGESQPSAVAAAQDLGEASTLPEFLFGYVDEIQNRAVIFLSHDPTAPDPTAQRMQKVRYVIGPTFLKQGD